MLTIATLISLLSSLAVAEATKKTVSLSRVQAVEKALSRRRRLDEEQVLVYGSDKIIFDKCISITVSPEDEDDAQLMFDDFAAYTGDGYLSKLASFVEFFVSDAYEGETHYLIDLPTFMQSVSEKSFEDHQMYCEACADLQEQCEADGRKLGGNNNNIKYVNCYSCEKLKCFNPNDEDDEQDQDEEQQQLNWDFDEYIYNIDDDDIGGWVENIAGCAQIEDADWNDQNLYAGFTCNPDHDGIHIGVFLDEECSLFLAAQSYAGLIYKAGSEDFNYLVDSQFSISWTLDNGVSCEANFEWQANNQNNQDENDDKDDDEEDNNEANEFCQNLLGQNSVPLATCVANGNDGNNNNDNNDANDDGNNWQVDYYTPLLDADEAQDIETVCALVNTFSDDLEEAFTYARGENFGFDYTDVTRKAAADAAREAQKAAGAGLSLSAITAIVAIAIAAFSVAGYFVYKKLYKKPASSPSPVEEGTTDKEEPLVQVTEKELS